MTFKELKQGYSIHILDKAEMTYKTEKVSNVSLPHIDAKMTSTGMVVDVTTTPSDCGSSSTYCVIADTDTAYPTNKVIATDRQPIIREVEALKSTSEQILSQTEHHKNMVDKCSALLAALDPIQKEKQLTEARFSSIETSINKMMSLLTKLSSK